MSKRKFDEIKKEVKKIITNYEESSSDEESKGLVVKKPKIIKENEMVKIRPTKNKEKILKIDEKIKNKELNIFKIDTRANQNVKKEIKEEKVENIEKTKMKSIEVEKNNEGDMSDYLKIINEIKEEKEKEKEKEKEEKKEGYDLKETTQAFLRKKHNFETGSTVSIAIPGSSLNPNLYSQQQISHLLSNISRVVSTFQIYEIVVYSEEGTIKKQENPEQLTEDINTFAGKHKIILKNRKSIALFGYTNTFKKIFIRKSSRFQIRKRIYEQRIKSSPKYKLVKIQRRSNNKSTEYRRYRIFQKMSCGCL
jgi:hypothetical protein